MTENIVLCGFMGSGKTTVGKRLAEMTGRRFIDTDLLIEEKTGKSINKIFADSGEGFFRTLEYDTVRKLSGTGNCVIAIGGGAAAEKDTAEAMRLLGKVVFLDVSAEEMQRRLKDDGSRPVLKCAGGTAEELMTARLPFYKAVSDYTVCADKAPEEVAREIKKLLCL